MGQALLALSQPLRDVYKRQELARAFLADESIQTPESLREKAGLLALLNLMGIVETFYNTGDSVEHEFSDEGHGVPVAQGQPEAPFRGQDPVSYTHLDVYKRQRLWSLAWAISWITAETVCTSLMPRRMAIS